MDKFDKWWCAVGEEGNEAFRIVAQAAWKAAVRQERERVAKIAEDFNKPYMAMVIREVRD